VAPASYAAAALREDRTNWAKITFITWRIPICPNPTSEDDFALKELTTDWVGRRGLCAFWARRGARIIHVAEHHLGPAATPSQGVAFLFNGP